MEVGLLQAQLVLTLTRSSGQYCDDIFRSWQSSPATAPNQNVQDCSDCILGLDQVQLNSPFGYDEDFASDFATQTSSCGKSGYTYTTPASYALNATATTTTSPSDTTSTACVATYAVVDGDTCNTVAQNNGVSTFRLLTANGISLDCSNFPYPGASLCIPPSCDTYTVALNDTCDSIVTGQAGMSSPQLLAWNPDINNMCSNLIVGNLICVR